MLKSTAKLLRLCDNNSCPEVANDISDVSEITLSFNDTNKFMQTVEDVEKKFSKNK